MGRPREFEEDEVLDRALRLFWTKGYEATSIQDLVEATGVQRASLYGAFGDKEQIFERVLAHYREKTSAAMADVAAAPTAVAALRALLSSWVGLSCQRSGPRGCLLVLSGSAGEHVPLAKEALGQALHQIELTVEGLVERGQASKEIGKHHDPARLAKFVVVQLLGLATAARGGWGRERLQQAIDETLALVAA